MSDLIEDCLNIILDELKDDLNSLYSCILVNRFWCTIGVQILWKNPYDILINRYYRKASNRSINKEFTPFNKFYNIIIYLLPTSSKQILIENDIISISTPFSSKPLFNYVDFYSCVPPNLIIDMGLALIKENRSSYKYREKYNILEQEYYKLFINNCRNIKIFYWTTTLPLYQYPGASTFFSHIHTLNIDYCQNSSSEILFEMAKICHNIENLKIWNCDTSVLGLDKFIDNQKNLQSLILYFKYQGIINIQLNEAIERKADALNELIIRNASLSPKFFSLLINLKYLKFTYSYYNNEQEIQELKRYLSIASFPKLQYLKSDCLPRLGICMIIENSHGNIKKINIWNYCHRVGQDHIYTKRLFKAIARNCPKIECLKVNISFESLSSIKEIFLNCTKLNELSLSLNDYNNNCDEILNILVDYSPKTFNHFSFGENFIFSVDGLQNFFERWRGRIPIKFVTRFDKCFHFTRDHIMVVKKYFDEGVIDKETRYLYGVK
jgi:hypothetical protein